MGDARGTDSAAYPQLRQRSYFPHLLEPRKRNEKALLAVVQETYVRGVKRRTRVVEIFPNGEPVIRLVGALLVEANEEWQAQRRYFGQESMRELSEPEPAQLGTPPPLTPAPVR